MGIIAWIVLGLGAGLLANMLIPGRRSQGLILTCLIGVAGALVGGWLATKLFHVHTLHGFFNLSTWLTAIAGAAILLLIFHLVTSRRNTSSRRRTAGAGRIGDQADPCRRRKPLRHGLKSVGQAVRADGAKARRGPDPAAYSPASAAQPPAATPQPRSAVIGCGDDSFPDRPFPARHGRS